MAEEFNFPFVCHICGADTQATNTEELNLLEDCWFINALIMLCENCENSVSAIDIIFVSEDLIDQLKKLNKKRLMLETSAF